MVINGMRKQEDSREVSFKKKKDEKGMSEKGIFKDSILKKIIRNNKILQYKNPKDRNPEDRNLKEKILKKRKFVKAAAALLACVAVLTVCGCASRDAGGAMGERGQQSGKIPQENSAGDRAVKNPAADASAEAAAETAMEDIPEEPYRRDDGGVSINVFAMDTYMTLVAYGDQAEEAVRAAAKEIHSLDELLSTGMETSEISRINAAGGGEPSPVVEKLLSESLTLADKTGGLFDIAIYPVMQVWGFPTQEYHVPEKSEIDAALKLADPSSITLITRSDVKKAREKAEKEARIKAAEEAVKKEQAQASGTAAEPALEEAQASGTAAEPALEETQAQAGGTAPGQTSESGKSAQPAKALKEEDYPSKPAVRFGKKGMEIDLGGIAKGYTGDKVGEVYSKYDIESGIISLGGNVQAFGSKENGKPWRVAVQNPESEMEYLGLLDVADKAIVTSGGYERFFEENGVRYHHIIDPRTGYPADSGLLSATIICDKGILADGLSTSLFIMGKDEAEKFWKNSGWDFDYILEDNEGTLYVTEGIADSFSTDAKTVVVTR